MLGGLGGDSPTDPHEVNARTASKAKSRSAGKATAGEVEVGAARVEVAVPAIDEVDLGVGTARSGRLQPLDDGERKEVLRENARQRGLELRPEVADFILSRHRRDLHALVSLIERLDEAALAAQRALTLPFVRGVMARERPVRYRE